MTSNNYITKLYNGVSKSEARYCAGPGWWFLIEKIFKLKEEFENAFVISQIKEKWGYLNCYINFTKDLDIDDSHSRINNIIDSISMESQIICENCGFPGEARKGGWIKTTCDFCNFINTKE